MQDGEDLEQDENAGGQDDTASDDNDVAKAKKKPAAGDEREDEEKRKKPASDDEDEESEDAEKASSNGDEDEEEEEDADKAASDNSDDNEDEEEEEEEASAGKKKQRKKDALTLTKVAKRALLGGLTDALERLMALAKRVQDAPEAKSGAVSEKLVSEISAVSEQLASLVETDSSGEKKAEVAKGARMAKERLDRFQKALSLLADILKELTESNEVPSGPSAGAAESGVKKGEGGAPVPGMAELVKGIGDLTRVVKRQEEELAAIRKTRGTSNAIPVDGAGRRPEAQEVSWPLDMNRPISRDKVKKEVSFFDE